VQATPLAEHKLGTHRAVHAEGHVLNVCASQLAPLRLRVAIDGDAFRSPLLAGSPAPISATIATVHERAASILRMDRFMASSSIAPGNHSGTRTLD
jgi:hypothetical protein